MATDDESSAWYVSSLAKTAGKVGIACDVVGLSTDIDSIRSTLGKLSDEATVHGVILQTPLPQGAKLEELAAEIDPDKDVDGANPVSLGRLASGLPAYAPATAEAVVALLDHYLLDGGGTCIRWCESPSLFIVSRWELK